jgi:iron complex transport system substrate-binding protein
MTTGRQSALPGTRRLRAFWLFVVLWQPLAGLQAATALAVIDDEGRKLTLAAPAQRIISLSPHVTELLFAVGAGPRIVGTIAHSDYPSGARRIRRIGDYRGLDIEAILALEPDLIVTWPSGNPPEQLQTLKRLGLPLFASDPVRLEDIPETLARLGRLTGDDAQAAEQAAAFQRRLQQLRVRYRDRAPVTVFVQIWRQPLMTVNGHHLISDVVKLCGGRNIFADLSALSAQVSTEAVLQADPDVIITTAEDGNDPPSLRDWHRWPTLKATRDGHLYGIAPDIIASDTPRILDGAARMCRLLEQARTNTTSHR